MILNPSDREASFACALVPTETVYSFGGEITAADGRIRIPANAAGYYKVQERPEREENGK